MSEQVSITLHGSSDDLAIVMECLSQARDDHWEAHRLAARDSHEEGARRIAWAALSAVLDRAEGAIDLLRIGRKHRPQPASAECDRSLLHFYG